MEVGAMSTKGRTMGKGRAPGTCQHEFQFDNELEDWLCTRCGRSFGLVTAEARHQCGPDCDIHDEVSGIG